MKKNIVIANWKMNLSPEDSIGLAEEILSQSDAWPTETEVVLCPAFDSLFEVARKVGKSKAALGAQDCFWEGEGAFTGEVSPKTLKSLGCAYVIIGHSERREHLGETDEMVNKKVRAALRNDLIPVICVGETFEERKEGQKDFVIMEQARRALKEVKLLSDDRLIVAYEPVWVIGSGQAVLPEEAEHANRVIRQVLLDNLSPEMVSEQTRLIYGGSVNPANVKGFLGQPTVHGILVGGASLKAETFNELIKQS